MCITISSSTSKRWGRDEPPKCSTVKKKHDYKVDDFLSNWRTWVISHPTKMEVQKWLKPRCFHLSPTPNPWLLPSAQSHHFCGWSNDLRLGVCSKQGERMDNTRDIASPSASFEKQKRGKTDHFITFIHFNITKFSNSERIVSVSRVVEAAMSLRKNPSLGDRIVVELIGDSFPKFEKSAHPVCPKTFCCYYDGKKTRENFRTYSSDMSLEKKNQPMSVCISSLDQLS